MQSGHHIGRISVSIRESREDRTLDVAILDRPNTLEMSDMASYLLVGGLGGLGRAVSRWMIERGARYLTYLSRNAGGTDDEQFVHELNSMGC